MSKKSKINVSDLRGITSIIADATKNITDLVEDMNKRIVHPPFLPSTPIQHLITGISSITFSSIRLTTNLVSGGLDKTLALFNPQLGIDISIEKKETTLAILNGVVGDYLVENKNALAKPMELRYEGTALSFNSNAIKKVIPTVNGKILLMVHGLCMNDRQWKYKEHNHGEALASELDFTPLYLSYNSGLHISSNGQQFNSILKELASAWPVPIESITILAHSMGGLVSRSAIHYASKEEKNWTKQLKKMVFLGTPHHGAPLEQIGNYIDRLFDAIPYVKPFARLGKMRSAGITDLRFGNLVDDDWNDRDRFEQQTDSRIPIPLPKKVSCYTVAATVGKEAKQLSSKLLGDGLVLTKSALGQHKKSNKNLIFKTPNTYIAFETNHMGLLNSHDVYDKIKTWLLLD